MSIKCGHCQSRHTAVADVRRCAEKAVMSSVTRKAIKAPHSCEDFDGECMGFMPECPYFNEAYAGRTETVRFELVDYQQGL